MIFCIIACVKAYSAPHNIVQFSPSVFKVKGFIVMDTQSGQVLEGENETIRLAPASLTKMMTIYLVAHALKKGEIQLKDQVVISEKAAKMKGSRMFITPFSRVVVEDLIQGVVVQSGNDASVALAEHLKGSETDFVNWMNQTAKALEMHDTHFKNATGLPAVNHYTTTFDLAKLARALIREFPEYYHWFSQKAFTYSNISQINRNRLLWLDIGADGIKTGETNEAGYCLAASAKKEGMRLIAIVMGAPSKEARTQVASELLEKGFRLFETKQYYSAQHVIKYSYVWGANQFKAPIGLMHDLYITMPRDGHQPIKQIIKLHTPLLAPLSQNEVVGELQLLLNDQCLTKAPLVVLKPIKQGSWLNRQLAYKLLSLKRVGTR